jgi:hypothetical protein
VKPAISCATLLLAALWAVVNASAQAQETMRTGLWQFTSQGEIPTTPSGFSPPQGAQSQLAGSFTNCIDPRAVYTRRSTIILPD